MVPYLRNFEQLQRFNIQCYIRDGGLCCFQPPNLHEGKEPIRHREFKKEDCENLRQDILNLDKQIKELQNG